LSVQEAVSNPIRSNTFRHSVLAAIRLDNQSGPEGNKINDVRTNRCLPTKMMTETFQFSKLHPELDLLRREAFAKRASVFV
jgi:hypothetical protein